MTLKIAMIGYGAVGAIHASVMAAEPGLELRAIYGPKPEKASAFASAHGFKTPVPPLRRPLPAPMWRLSLSLGLHFQQAYECLDHGLHTLVELPPCLTARKQRLWGNWRAGAESCWDAPTPAAFWLPIDDSR